MFNSTQSVVYNFRDQKDSALISESQITTPLSKFNADLIEFIMQNCNDKDPVIIINAASQLPPYWQQRLIQPLLENDRILVCSALSTEFYTLSPLADKQLFHGDLMQLDSQVYQIQRPGYFASNDINPDCFVTRNKHCLSAISHRTYVVNNLVVQPKRRKPLRLREKLKLGDQKLLPAHPLANLQIKLAEQNNAFEINYPLLDDRPCLLHICMDWGGGVAKWINDFAATHLEYHHFVLNSCGELYRYTHGEKYNLSYGSTSGLLLDEYDLTAPIKATIDQHPEYQAMLASIIKQRQIQAVFVSTLIGHSMECLDTGLPTFRILHDYFPHWPSLNAKLDKKTISDSDLSQALLDSCDEPFSCIKPAQFQSWQITLSTLLKDKAVRLIAPSHSVKNNLLKLKNSDYFAKTQIIPHAIKPIKAINYQPQAELFKILVLGRIGVAKGQVLLEQCVKLLGKHKAIKFIFLGAGNEGKKYLPTKSIKVIMDYTQKQLPSLLADLSPQLALITSITSESFSYTLTELQSAGIPVLSTRVGALQERIEDRQTGFLSTSTAEDICKLILSLKNNPKLLLQVHGNLKQLKQASISQVKQHYQSLLNKIPFKSPEYQLLHALIKPSQLAQKFQILSNVNQDLEAHLNLSEENLAKRTSWAQELGKHNQHLEKNLDLERDESKHLKTVIKQKDRGFKKETKHLKSVIKTVQEAEHQTQVKLEALKNELNLVYESSSWKITQPLRNFTLWYRNKKNQLGFRFRQLKTSPKRLVGSLKSRGVPGSLKAIKTKLSKPKPKKPISTVVIKKDYQPIKIKTSKTPTVSIIVPVFNHFEHTYHCLKSLSELTDTTTFEIILIDDCSTDETSQKIKLVKGIGYHRQVKNGGFITSCNTGANRAKGKYLLFLNNDTQVHNNWLDALLNTFDQHPDTGLVGSKLIYPDGRLQEAGGIVFSDGSGWNYGRFDDPAYPEYNHIREVSYCSGASILIAQQLFESLGQFDQLYKPAYYEDTDLAFKVRKAGKKVFYQPASVLTHFEGISSGTDISTGIKKYQLINQQNFLKKWSVALRKQPQTGTDIEICRFQNKPKRILILDACTPTPDQDSGSLRMTNIIKIFNELNYQVSFIAENMTYFGQYTIDLQQLGVECLYGPKYKTPVDYLKSHGKYFDLVFLSRYYVAEPVMPFIRQYCPKAKLFFDTVDLHYLREQRLAELDNDKQLRLSAAKTKKSELKIAKQCDVTLVVSSYEQQILSEENSGLDVRVLSNIHQIYGCLKPFAQRKDIMFIGGYQHTPNVDGIIWFVDEIFPLIQQAIPDIKLHIIGSKAPSQVKKLGQIKGIVFHGFVTDIEPFMSDIRLAVAPLRFGAGVKGKVNMSMSYGQPVVATKLAVEGMFTIHKKDVMIADEPADFASQLVEIYQQEELWNTVSKGGLENVKKWFSFAAAKKQISKIIKH